MGVLTKPTINLKWTIDFFQKMFFLVFVGNIQLEQFLWKISSQPTQLKMENSTNVIFLKASLKNRIIWDKTHHQHCYHWVLLFCRQKH